MKESRIHHVITREGFCGFADMGTGIRGIDSEEIDIMIPRIRNNTAELYLYPDCSHLFILVIQFNGEIHCIHADAADAAACIRVVL